MHLTVFVRLKADEAQNKDGRGEGSSTQEEERMGTVVRKAN